MRVTTRSRSSGPAQARRSQIIRATVDTLAALGYAKASFAEIARRGGLSSTRLISYHFDDRTELMNAVAGTVVADLGATVSSAMQATDGAREAVHAYLRSNVRFVDTHRAEMTALATLLFAGVLQPSPEPSDGTEQALAALIAAGTEQGQFGEVDPVVAAGVLQRAVEGVSLQLYRNPDLDLEHYAEKLITFVDSGLQGPR